MVHLLIPPPPKCTDQHFWVPQYGFHATTKNNPYLKPDWYVTSDRFG